MNSLNIPEIISIEKIVKITSAQEAGSLKVKKMNGVLMFII